jgi:Prenyltransferase and squalene oxidase repeat
VTWQIGAFTVLGLALAAGFAWYERTRPDARIVALVATLAAFAALGRIAFAAVPNVKPTTDIVLISGFALGPAPGFVVGAVAGLASNFFFGQGPWTPWQMAGWGATGLIGAALAGLSRGRLRRWPLALVCLVVGFAFTALQDVGDWVNYSDHSVDQLGVYVGKGLGFDAVHAAGCLLFALAFGPALARSLARFTTRLRVTWRAPDGVIAPLLLALVLAGGIGAARAASTPTGYLLAAQNRDGGFGPAPGQASAQLYSGWAALGLAAAGEDPAQVSRNGRSLIAYLRSGVAADNDPGSLERTILAAVAAGANPRSFGGRNLVGSLESRIRHNGSVSGQTNLTSFAVLALRAAGVSVPADTVRWLLAQQDRDGGFNFATAPGASDVDDTGAVLEALAMDSDRAARKRAVAFIERHQNRDGGFPATAGATSNAQSTAWAVQGLLSAGVDPASVRRGGAPSPLAYLGSLIASDGHVRYARGNNQTPVWVTAEAEMALAGKTLPLSPVRPRHREAPAAPASTPASRPSPHGKAKQRRGAKHGGRARRGKAPSAAGTVPGAAAAVPARLVTDAGILDALVLAPVGIG